MFDLSLQMVRATFLLTESLLTIEPRTCKLIVETSFYSKYIFNL
jgi:hypothetical protein